MAQDASKSLLHFPISDILRKNYPSARITIFLAKDATVASTFGGSVIEFFGSCSFIKSEVMSVTELNLSGLFHSSPITSSKEECGGITVLREVFALRLVHNIVARGLKLLGSREFCYISPESSSDPEPGSSPYSVVEEEEEEEAEAECLLDFCTFCSPFCSPFCSCWDFLTF